MVSMKIVELAQCEAKTFDIESSFISCKPIKTNQMPPSVFGTANLS